MKRVDGYRPLENQKQPAPRTTIKEMLAGIGKPMIKSGRAEVVEDQTAR